jgi:hypothetical protein
MTREKILEAMPENTGTYQYTAKDMAQALLSVVLNMNEEIETLLAVTSSMDKEIKDLKLQIEEIEERSKL